MFHAALNSSSSTLVADLVKTGSGLLIGFILGLVAEPIKMLIKTRVEVREAEKLLMEEIELVAKQSAILWEIYAFDYGKSPDREIGTWRFRLDRYSHLQRNQPSALLKIKGYERVRRVLDECAEAGGRQLTVKDAGNITFHLMAPRRDRIGSAS